MANTDEDKVVQARLNQREKEILSLLAKLYTDDEIAKELHISMQTLYNNFYIIKRIIGINKRPHLTRYAQEHYGNGVPA